MHRFFTEEINSASGEIRLDGSEARHAAQVLRLCPGNLIDVGAGDGRDYTCRITKISAEEVLAVIEDISGNAAELPVRITLYQGFPKGDKLDLIIQKAVELGAERIVPVWMSRSIVKMDAAKAAKRRDRYQAIAEAAAKQSGRGVIPEVGAFLGMKDAVEEARGLDRILLPYENAKGMNHARSCIEDLSRDAEKGDVQSLGIFIGPEGGFEASEVEMLEEAGALTISLGHRILRTETAGLALLSILGFRMDRDM